MSGSIFIIEEETWVSESGSGHDFYEFVIDADLGYFPTKEAAQAHIDRLRAEAEEKYNADLADSERKQSEHEVQRARDIDALRARADAAGIPQASVNFPKRQFFAKPRPSNYFKERRIVEIEPAS